MHIKGTHIVYGFVRSGAWLYREQFMTCEFSHVRMNGVTYERVCVCSPIGCLESMHPRTGMARQALEAIRGKKTNGIR
ncbi:hypothetical protein [Paenibacillus sp. DMB20]|uniref:hypothetical protein n=1 Tax=Paenibacillus sp. DMB20 TaxID=1642570 RepID=UPI000B2BC595|nr:hypothetical protein [Paenibacillus sp. DMB20]